MIFYSKKKLRNKAFVFLSNFTINNKHINSITCSNSMQNNLRTIIFNSIVFLLANKFPTTEVQYDFI